MAVRWSDGGPDVLLAIDRDAGPVGRQLQDQLRAAIRDHRIGADERLPSTRRLADHLGIARGTVVEAYEQLAAEGYVESTTGSGTRVSATPPPGPATLHRAAPVAPPAPIPAIDFEYGVPDLRTVPLGDWGRALSAAARTLPTAQLGVEDAAGSRHLREVVTSYHRRVRAGTATADDAVIVSGFRQGLALTLAALARRGIRRIGVEDPGPRDHALIAQRAGLEPVPIPVDGDGAEVEHLLGTGARAVLLTPAHQCPTGVALSPARRRALMAWAEDVDGIILEDDYDAEFRYDRRPVGSLQGLNPTRVVALGSVSKTLAPALRLGWVLAPPSLAPAIVEEKRLSSRGAPALDQEALAILMETGRFDRHLRRMREIYRSRRDVLAAEVTATFGPGRLRGLAAGCHALLLLPDGSSASAIAAAGAAEGVRVETLERYRSVAGADPAVVLPAALVLGFGNVDEDGIRRGIRILAEAARMRSGDRCAFFME
jgi:GntR family transcriptional regulator/MocR family aminotransferase